MHELSIVIPVMNEEDNILLLIQAINKAVLNINYEIIFVDDGSTDSTKTKIKEQLNEKIVLLELKKNYGQSAAMTAGIDYSSGEYIALMDGDLQNDPDDIPFMLEKIKAEDWDIVAGNRAKRKDGIFLRKIPSKIANAIIRILAKTNIHDFGCTLKVFKRDIALELNLHGELHRFIPLIASFSGARITQVDVKHHPRQSGKTKYGLNRTFRVISDLIMLLFFKRYSQKPMHFFGMLGIVCFFLGSVINLYLLGLKVLMGYNIGGRPLLILGIFLLVSGIQFISIGILLEATSNSKKSYSIHKVYTNVQ
jgi:glycosyltransferase involved in cell wall biosynthesis